MALLVFDVVGPRLQSKRYLGLFYLFTTRPESPGPWEIVVLARVSGHTGNHDRFVENAQDSDRSLGRSAVRR
jgi:hypothetical protein